MTVEDVLDDVPDGAHRCFMKQYLRDWPYPRTFKYAPGQHFTVELNGVMQRCEVAAVDCSLVQVVFQVGSVLFLCLVCYVSCHQDEVKMLVSLHYSSPILINNKGRKTCQFIRNFETYGGFPNRTLAKLESTFYDCC